MDFVQFFAQNLQCFGITADGDLYGWGLNDVIYDIYGLFIVWTDW